MQILSAIKLLNTSAGLPLLTARLPFALRLANQTYKAMIRIFIKTHYLKWTQVADKVVDKILLADY